MGQTSSPDRPVAFYLKLLGIRDEHPPITDHEFASYKRFRDGKRFMPADILATFPSCPATISAKTRAEIRILLGDPRLPAALELMDTARAREDAADKEREKEEEKKREAARVGAESRKLAISLKAIDEFYENQLNDKRFMFADFQRLIGDKSVGEAALRMTHESYSEHKKGQRALNLSLATQGGGKGAAVFGILAGVENKLRDESNARQTASKLAGISIRRSLVSMDDIERATLRMADTLVALDAMTGDERLAIAVPIVWNDGQCDIDFGGVDSEFRVRTAMLENLKPLLASGLSTSAGARERLNEAVRRALAPSSRLAEGARDVIERYLYSGNRWMLEREGVGALGDETSPTSLRLGGFPGSSSEMLYDLRESLITVAPPGAAKSQAHVLRNLLYLEAPAVVLDVKGEALASTRKWREGVGRTYAFTPHVPEESLRYNPLDAIRTDNELAWEDARRLADLLVVPSTSRSSDDGYFEGRARDLITTALLDVALSEESEFRNMTAVLDRLYGSGDARIKEWCEYLKSLGNTQLRRQAEALEGMPERQRESILDTARRQLEIWQSPAIEKITRETTFRPDALRGEKATLYLAVSLEDIKKFASVLRVLIGQTMHELYRAKPETGALPVTFFLDEFPRLGRMDVLEEALDAGRGYGIRLWMFCQNYGQLQTVYPNGQGMMSNCAVRCFMNPDEDSARWIAENLGSRQGLLDGKRKPLVEAHQLTGPEFAEQIVVFSRGNPPARLDKKPAYGDPVCQARIVGEESKRDVPIAESAPETIGTPDVSASEPTTELPQWNSLGVAPTPAPLRQTAPVAILARTAPPRATLVAGAAVLALLFGMGVWLVIQGRELQSLRNETASLAASAREIGTRASQSLAAERDKSARTLRSVEQERDQLRIAIQTARADLQREAEAHATTKDRLADMQRQLDAERVSHSQSMAQPPAPAPQSNATPMAAQVATATPAFSAPVVVQAALPAVRQPIVTDCDTLAANPHDRRRVTDGVKFIDLRRNAAAAIDACDRALAASPGELRFGYQRARALHAANDPAAQRAFDALVNAGYPAAFDNAGQLMVDQRRWRDAEALYRRGVQLEDMDSMVALADQIRSGNIPARISGEDVILYEKAASLGHASAQKDVEQRRAGAAVINQVGTFFRSLGR